MDASKATVVRESDMDATEGQCRGNRREDTTSVLCNAVGCLFIGIYFWEEQRNPGYLMLGRHFARILGMERSVMFGAYLLWAQWFSSVLLAVASPHSLGVGFRTSHCSSGSHL